MKKIFLMIAMMVSLTCLANSTNDDLLIGRWSYKASDAPYGYDKGEVKFSKVDDKLAAVVTTSSGEIKINKIIKSNKAYLCQFYVEGSLVELTLTQNKDKLKGSAKVDYSRVDIIFEKIKSCQMQ